VVSPERLNDLSEQEGEGGGRDAIMQDEEQQTKEQGTNASAPAATVSRNMELLQQTMSINRQHKAALDEIKSSLMEVEHNAARVQERLGAPETTKARDAAQAEKQARARELNVETQRQLTVKDACHRSRLRCGEYAKELVEFVRYCCCISVSLPCQSKCICRHRAKRFVHIVIHSQDKLHCEKQKEYKSKDKEISQAIDRLDEEIHDLESKELADLEASLSTITAELNLLSNQIVIAEEIRQKRAKIEMQRDAVALDVVALNAEKNKTEQLLNETQVKLAACEERLEQVKQSEEKLASIKAMNDEMEKGKVANSMADRVILAKENELCAGRINELHLESKEFDERHSVEVAKQLVAIASIQAEYKSLKEDALLKKKERLDIERKYEELLASNTKEIESHESLISKLEEAVKMELENQNDILQQREKEKDEKMAKLLEENSKIRDAAEYKLSVVKMGAEALQSNEEKYQQIVRKPIDEHTFTEEGIDPNDLQDMDKQITPFQE